MHISPLKHRELAVNVLDPTLPSRILGQPEPDDRPGPAPRRDGGPGAPHGGMASSLRWPAAAAALVAAVAHVPVTGQHLSEVPYVGWLFVALTGVCMFAAFALAFTSRAVVWALAGATCLAAVIAFVISRGPGLPGMPDDIGDWGNELGLISVACELAVVALAVVALAGRRARAASWWLASVPLIASGLVGATYALGAGTT
jgi:hypothetical protein